MLRVIVWLREILIFFELLNLHYKFTLTAQTMVLSVIKHLGAVCLDWKLMPRWKKNYSEY